MGLQTIEQFYFAFYSNFLFWFYSHLDWIISNQLVFSLGYDYYASAQVEKKNNPSTLLARDWWTMDQCDVMWCTADQ